MAGSVSVAPAVTQSALLDNDDEPPPHQQLYQQSEQPSQLSAKLRQGPPAYLNSQSQRPSPPNHSSTEQVLQQSRDLHSLQANGAAATNNNTTTTTPAPFSSSTSPSPLSPLRQFSTAEVEVHDTIPEESDETDWDSPNEPVTPVSGRQSRDGFQRNTEFEADPAPGAVAVPIPIPGGNQSHKYHSQAQSQHHQRNPSDSNESSCAESTEIFSVDGSLSNSVGQSAPATLQTALASSRQPLSPSGASGLTTPQTSTNERPNTPTTRPTTAVTGSFVIAPPTASSSANATANGSATGSTTEASSVTAVNSVSNVEPTPSPTQVRRSRNSSSGTSFKRTMSNLFRRNNNAQADKATYNASDYDTSSSDANLAAMAPNGVNMPNHRKMPSRRWSMNRSLVNNQSTSPPSPPSPSSPPLEMTMGARRRGGAHIMTAGAAAANGMPTEADFMQNESKKARQRASTGISLSNAVHKVTGSTGGVHRKVGFLRRRANSFEHGSQHPPVEIAVEPWALPAEAGTGLKARRMSLSLPDDFTVDVAVLHNEFDYQHLLGRHRRNLGKGATSNVTLMYRKGFPDELYAVKEFRGKSSNESPTEYEKKVKSEFTIAKSLRHPNIIETFRLCTDHGRWDHVMEYCSDGDLFSLVEKKYLLAPEREKDRLCLFKQLIMGLNYLHSNGIAHRDIKLENLLITGGCKLKITDFGASDIFSGIHPGLREAGGRCGVHVDDTVRLCRPGICGSLPYISPEVLEARDPYDPRKLDVWAAAIVMVHLIFGAPLWTEARIKPGQPNPQYKSLLRAWSKWNGKFLAERQEAEELYAKRLAAAREEEEKKLAEKTKNVNGDVDAADMVVPAPAPASAAAAAPVGAAAAAATAAVAPAAAAPSERPFISAAPLTDGNPNSILEGDYPKQEAFDAIISPPVLRRILLHMLNPDPKRRVTIEQVAKLRWIRNIECCQQDSYDDSLAPSSGPPPPRVIDASKRSGTGLGSMKIYCHNHRPPQTNANSRSIGRV